MSYILKYKIKEIRKEMGIRIVNLATKCQVTEKTMRDWENITSDDERSIPSDMLLKISQMLGMSMEELYNYQLQP